MDRNINPTPAAVVAMNLYGGEYSRQRGGSMDFWDHLDAYRKRQCEDLVSKVLAAAVMHGVCSINTAERGDQESRT